MNFTTYSSKVDYTYTCTKTRHNTLKTKFEGKKGLDCEGNKFLTFSQCLLLIGYNNNYYYPIKWHQGLGLQVTQYIGALGKPCTGITIDRKVLSILHLTCVVLDYIPVM